MRAMNTVSGLILGSALSLWAFAGQASAQSYDCSQSAQASERAVCGSDRLSGLDERMSSLYDALMSATTSDRGRAKLRRYQLHFLAARDACGRNTSCIKGAYLDQISVLQSRLRVAQRDAD